MSVLLCFKSLGDMGWSRVHLEARCRDGVQNTNSEEPLLDFVFGLLNNTQDTSAGQAILSSLFLSLPFNLYKKSNIG